MFRIELLVYAQLVGVLLTYAGYEYKAAFGKENVLFKNFVEHNSSPGGVFFWYFPVLIVFAAFMTLWRLLSERTPIDLVICSLVGVTGFWVKEHLLPLENSFSYESSLLNLFLHHHAFAALLVTIIVLCLLASRTDYQKDPVELIFLHIIAGVVAVDASYGVPVVFHEHVNLQHHFNHVTSGVGGFLVDFVIPGILGVLVIFLIYRIYQGRWLDILVFILFSLAAALFGLFVLPVEMQLFNTKKPNKNDQQLLVYSHLIFLFLIFFATSSKLMSHYLENDPSPPPAITNKGK